MDRLLGDGCFTAMCNVCNVLVRFYVVLYVFMFSWASFTIFTVSFVYYFCDVQWLHFVM